MDAEHDEQVNFYGVIIDANFPFKQAENKYVCNLKVVDQSLNVHGNTDEFACVIMTGRRFEDLPICQRVGDIIRCHRADFFMARQGEDRFLKLNMTYNSSWALFSADDIVAPEVEDECEDWQYKPYAYSGWNYTIEKNDRKVLENIRQWSKKYFQT